MLNITKMRLYPFFSKDIYIPKDEKQKYSIIFYPENSTFMDAYPVLNIRKQYVKRVSYISSKIPIMRATMDKLMEYKKIKLFPFLTQKPKENVFLDATKFLDIVDSKYSKKSYKRPLVKQKISDYITNLQNYLPNKSILLYYIDMSKPVDLNIINRRIYVLYEFAKSRDGEFPFDIVCLSSKTKRGMIYSVIYNKQYGKKLQLNRIFGILKRFISKPDSATSGEEQETEDGKDQKSTNNVVTKLLSLINKGN